MRRVLSSRTGRALLTGAGAAGAAAAVAALTALGGGQLGALSLSLLVLGAAFLARRPRVAFPAELPAAGQPGTAERRPS